MHDGAVTGIYVGRYYLYSCGEDYTIAKTYYGKSCKVERRTKLRGDWLRKIVKIEHKKLKDIVFGIDRRGRELLMID